MSNQTFQSAVGQVAGGDINNYRAYDPDQMSREDVATYLLHIQTRLWDARKKILLNPYVAWMVIGAVAFFATVLTADVFVQTTQLALTMLVGLIFPLFPVASVNRKYCQMIFAYRQEISRIEIFQHARGWA